jgi:hypothetical protein
MTYTIDCGRDGVATVTFSADGEPVCSLCGTRRQPVGPDCVHVLLAWRIIAQELDAEDDAAHRAELAQAEQDAYQASHEHDDEARSYGLAVEVA